MIKASLFGVKLRVITKDRELIERQITNWHVLDTHINFMDTDDLMRAMLVEKHTRKRINILNRLYGKFYKLRAETERRELYE